MKYLLILILISGCSIRVKYDKESGYYISNKEVKSRYPIPTDCTYRSPENITYKIWIDKRRNRFIYVNGKRVKLKPR